MYRTGHLGVVLLVFAPIGYLLADAGAELAALLTGGVLFWLVMLPDVDTRIPVVSHRGVTHSLVFAVGVGMAFAAFGVALVQISGGALAAELLGLDTLGIGVVPFGFALGLLSVTSHLLGDLLTPAGVNLLWPHPTEFSLSIARADSVIVNYGLFLLGAVAVGTATVLLLGLV